MNFEKELTIQEAKQTLETLATREQTPHIRSFGEKLVQSVRQARQDYQTTQMTSSFANLIDQVEETQQFLNYQVPTLG